MLLKRVIVALIAIPLIYLCLTELPPIYFLLIVMVISAAAQYEFCSMYKSSGIMSALSIAGGSALLASLYFQSAPEAGLTGLMTPLVISVIVITSVRLFIIKEPSSAFIDIAPSVFAVLYIPMLLAPMWYLRLAGYEWIILLLTCVWSADTFAYFIGKNFGKQRLYKEISPNKTVAGAVGSVAGGAVAAIIFGGLFIKDLGVPALILTGTVLGTVTIIGDLVESMFKRDAGIKDSGAMIPGHGGFLDRIDSILFAAPALYFLKIML
jgi:phosphatidate cytidylyltransferase